jgi:hypothetical protein
MFEEKVSSLAYGWIVKNSEKQEETKKVKYDQTVKGPE